jgi:two-component system chemotaxis response regulator CheY
MARATATQAEPLSNGKLKLMICDDSNIIRRKIEREFKIDRLQVIATAANGRLAVEAFTREPADVVTMDITMPEMDGIECVEKLVAIKPDVLILIISALSDKATAIEALKRGANGFLCKPFTDRQLTEALEELLRGAANDD